MNTNQVAEHGFRSRLGEEFAQCRIMRSATDWLLLLTFAAELRAPAPGIVFVRSGVRR